MDRGAWRAIVHGDEKSQTRLSTHTHTRSRITGSFEKSVFGAGAGGGTVVLFPSVTVPFYIPTSRVHRISISPYFHQHFLNFLLKYDSHPNECEVTSHCGFDLHFPRD